MVEYGVSEEDEKCFITCFLKFVNNKTISAIFHIKIINPVEDYEPSNANDPNFLFSIYF